MDSNTTKDQKIRETAQRMAKSQAFRDFATLPVEQWELFLKQMDEAALQDCILLLNEEDQTYEEIDKKAVKRQEVNKTRLLQRLEKNRLEAHQTLSKKHG